MATTIRDNSYTAKPQLAAYRYDQLNRIKQMQTYQSITSNAWGSTSTNAYKEVYAYDANGNIKTLERYDGAATPVKIDNLTYGYNKDGSGKLVNNRLRHVKDAQSALLCNYDIDNQNDDNYLYDAIGNLTKDNAEGIDNIEWNAYGKIKSITRAPGVQKSNLEFIYDAMGNRVCKIEKPYNLTSTAWKYTFYVRDASGNIMSTYTKTGDQIEDAVITLDEIMLYGSSRLGVRQVGKTIAQLEAETSLYLFNRRLGLKRYEMSNHLGNVLTTFTDRKQQVQSSGLVTGYKTYISSAQDYYPFGMQMANRGTNPISNTYKFGFNGAEKDDEIKGIGNSYTTEWRQYDPRLGRWLSPDPLMAKFPDWSPYVFAFDNPIWLNDPEGDTPPTIKQAIEKGKKESTTFSVLLLVNKVTLDNYSSIISFATKTETTTEEGKITITKGEDIKFQIIKLTHELTNRKNLKLVQKADRDVKTGKITPKQYAKQLADIEIEGQINQIKVAAEIGYKYEGPDYKEINEVIDKYKKGKIDLKKVVGASDEHLEAYEKQGSLLREDYLKEEEEKRNTPTRHLTEKDPPIY